MILQSLTSEKQLQIYHVYMQNKLYTANTIRHLYNCVMIKNIIYLTTGKGMHVQFEVSVPNTYLRMIRYFFSSTGSYLNCPVLTSSAPNY